jgi:hypothetical protein
MRRDDRIAFANEIVEKHLINFYSEQKSGVIKTKILAILEVDLMKHPFVPGERDLD